MRRICRLRPSSITISTQALRSPWRSNSADFVVSVSLPSTVPARRRSMKASSGTSAGRHGVDLDVVCLLDARCGIENALGPARVVAHQQQAFAGHVEATDGRDEGQGEIAESVIDCRAALRIAARGDDTAQLVDHQVDALIGADRFPIHHDARAVHVDAQAGMQGEATIDLDAPLADQLLGLGARAVAEL
jgi:hypothetical protein